MPLLVLELEVVPELGGVAGLHRDVLDELLDLRLAHLQQVERVVVAGVVERVDLQPAQSSAKKRGGRRAS
jgi:hypothetical protein